MYPWHVGIDMEAEHSRETLDFDEFASDYSLPRWRVRRISIKMSHYDGLESKVLLD
jgi:hypothetical protein